MQIDFHHGVTYVVARLAGFPPEEADIIAHSAQYVDDATNAGLIHFDNGAVFSRTSSAHKTLDYRNFRKLSHYKVWIPFHFLPGNGGCPQGETPKGNFIHKLICLPNSYIAQDMLKQCIQNCYKPYGLHQLGISMHVYADTWAHQGFAGINHAVNEARLFVDGKGNPDHNFRQRVAKYFEKNLCERLANLVVSEALPLGHGAVLGHPDKPYLKWGYTNGLGQRIERNNPQDFLEAAEHMCQWMRRYRLGQTDADVPGLPPEDKALIARMFRHVTDARDELRYQKWLLAITKGEFSFGCEAVNYSAKGKGSWKYEALKTEAETETGKEIFPYNPHFLESNWKRFHDALEAHRFNVIHDILPQYGICIA